MKISALLLVLLGACCIPAAAQQLPLEDFTRHGDFLDMKLSPDGKHIAARVRNEGKVGFLVLETDSMQVVGGVTSKAGEEIHSVEWINDERLVYQNAEEHIKYDHPVATGELFAINYDNTQHTVLFGYGAGQAFKASRLNKREDSVASAEIISYLPEDDRRILIAEYPWERRGHSYYATRERPPNIVLLDVYKGHKKTVETLPYRVAVPLASETGEVNFVRYQDESAHFRAAFRTDRDSDWQDLSEELGSGYVPLALSNDGKRVFLQANAGVAQLTTMVEFNLETLSLTTLFEGMQADIEEFLWDPQLDRPVVGVSYPARHQYHYAPGDSDTARWHRMLAASFDGQNVILESHSKDRKRILLHVSSDTNPGEYYLFDTQSKRASFLWANRSWLDPRTLAPSTPFAFTANDGVQVHGYVTLPKDRKDGETLPFVTLIHGGPHNVRDYANFNSEVQLLANRGYAVVRVNFRGSDGYGDAFRQLGYRQWGGAMIDDILQGTTEAVDRFSLNPDRGCVYGASYGGYAAMMSAVRAPDMFQCVIGYIGVYNLHYAFSESDTTDSFGGLAYLKRALGTDDAQLSAYSPVNHAAKISAKVMIIHGEQDTRVPVINAEKMAEQLTLAGNKPVYLSFGRSGHGVFDEAGRKTLYQALLDFLAAHID
tara:strand:+ start:22054 stop:24024 length:1971 start_codon:yes stop_codon:yes gene_type:complete